MACLERNSDTSWASGRCDPLANSLYHRLRLGRCTSWRFRRARHSPRAALTFLVARVLRRTLAACIPRRGRRLNWHNAVVRLPVRQSTTAPEGRRSRSEKCRGTNRWHWSHAVPWPPRGHWHLATSHRLCGWRSPGSREFCSCLRRRSPCRRQSGLGDECHGQ